MAYKGFIFTDRAESKKGIMSAFFGALSLISLLLAVYLVYASEGETAVRYGVVGFLCLIFAAAGMTLGILAKMEEDRFYLFAWVGIVLNGLTLAGILGILYVGAYGI